MHLACYTQQAIADAVGMAQNTVTEKIAEIIENGSNADSDIFHNFEERKIYTVWNFPKSTNEVKHFGNIPPEIIDNLLFTLARGE